MAKDKIQDHAQRLMATLLGFGLASTLTGSAPTMTQSPQQATDPAIPPVTPQEPYGPFVDFNRLPLTQDWAVKRKIKQHHQQEKTTDPVIYTATNTPDGDTIQKNYQGKPDQTRDIASVGKILSIIMIDDLIEKKTIKLDDKLNPTDLKEAGLKEGTTFRDAIAAAYVESNNFAIHTAVKSAVRADMKIPDNQTIPNQQVAEYLSRYMISEKMDKSIQFNGAGYPVNADEFSAPFSFKGAPSRINQFDVRETTHFFERKICDEGLSPQVERMLNLKNGTPQMQHPIDSDQVRTLLPSGFARNSLEVLGPKNNLVIAKTGTSNEASAGLIATRDKYGNCQVALGIGQVEDRVSTIPDVALDNQEKSFSSDKQPRVNLAGVGAFPVIPHKRSP